MSGETTPGGLARRTRVTTRETTSEVGREHRVALRCVALRCFFVTSKHLGRPEVGREHREDGRHAVAEPLAALDGHPEDDHRGQRKQDRGEQHL